MRTLWKHLLSSTMALAVALALSPLIASAQEPAPDAAQCTAQLQPATIQAGEEAVQVTAVLSEDIGPISEFAGAGGGGPTLADPADIPRAEMANPEEEPRPIAMTPDASSVSLWLSTEGVSPGEFVVQLQSSQGSCTGQLTVVDG